MLRREPDARQELGAVEAAQVAMPAVAQHRHDRVPRAERPCHLPQAAHVNPQHQRALLPSTGANSSPCLCLLHVCMDGRPEHGGNAVQQVHRFRAHWFGGDMQGPMAASMHTMH